MDQVDCIIKSIRLCCEVTLSLQYLPINIILLNSALFFGVDFFYNFPFINQ